MKHNIKHLKNSNGNSNDDLEQAPRRGAQSKVNWDNKPVVVLLIFAEWCGHCQNFKPTWNSLKSNNENNENVQFIEVEDVNMDKELDTINSMLFKNSETKIDRNRGYPTLAKIEGGKVDYYENERSSESIAKWIGHNVKPSIIGGSLSHMMKKNGGKNGKRRCNATKYKKRKSVCNKYKLRETRKTRHY